MSNKRLREIIGSMRDLMAEASRLVLLEEDMDEGEFLLTRVLDQVCPVLSVERTRILGPRRDAQTVLARQVVMFILVEDFHLSPSYVGRLLNRNHATVNHGVGKVWGYIGDKSGISGQIEGIRSSLDLGD